MDSIDGGTLVGRALANEGVDRAFVLCGGHIMPALYGMRNAGIEIIDMRHECSAVYAAIAYARASGKIATMWDGYGEQVTDPDEIVPAIRRAAANRKPSIVNVQVDNESLSPFIAPYTEMVKGQ